MSSIHAVAVLRKNLWLSALILEVDPAPAPRRCFLMADSARYTTHTVHVIHQSQ